MDNEEHKLGNFFFAPTLFLSQQFKAIRHEINSKVSLPLDDYPDFCESTGSSEPSTEWF